MSCTVIVVLVTFNRKECLKVCLSALEQQSVPITSVILIDNASSDGTKEYVENYDGSLSLDSYRLEHNTGGAGGFAFGLSRARALESDWIWIMDDDVNPVPDCLENLLAAPDHFDVRQPCRYYTDGQFVVSEAVSFNLLNPMRSLKSGMVRKAPSEDLRIEAFPFEGPLIRSSVVKRTEAPIASFFILYDDTEYAIRLKKDGVQVCLVAGAVMIRQLKPSGSKSLGWKFEYFLRNSTEVDYLHGNFWVGLLRPILRAIRFTLTGIFYRRPWREIVMPFRMLFYRYLGK